MNTSKLLETVKSEDNNKHFPCKGFLTTSVKIVMFNYKSLNVKPYEQTISTKNFHKLNKLFEQCTSSAKNLKYYAVHVSSEL